MKRGFNQTYVSYGTNPQVGNERCHIFDIYVSNAGVFGHLRAREFVEKVAVLFQHFGHCLLDVALVKAPLEELINGASHGLLLTDSLVFGEARQRRVLLFCESKCHGHDTMVPS